jgi:hypothetical protein
VVKKLALVSQLTIYKDIIPGCPLPFQAQANRKISNPSSYRFREIGQSFNRSQATPNVRTTPSFELQSLHCFSRLSHKVCPIRDRGQITESRGRNVCGQSSRRSSAFQFSNRNTETCRLSTIPTTSRRSFCQESRSVGNVIPRG